MNRKINGLWQNGTPNHQKWLISVFLLCLLGALAPIFWRGFIPAPHWRITATYLALLLIAVSCMLLRALYRRGLWRPVGPWLTYSPLKRWLMAPLCLAFFFGVLWLNISSSLPMAYTVLLGQDSSRTAMVEKKRGSGKSCPYQFKIEGVGYLFFEFCIDRESFEQYPAGSLSALLNVRQSFFGEFVQSMQINTAKGDLHE